MVVVLVLVVLVLVMVAVEVGITFFLLFERRGLASLLGKER